MNRTHDWKLNVRCSCWRLCSFRPSSRLRLHLHPPHTRPRAQRRAVGRGTLAANGLETLQGLQAQTPQHPVPPREPGRLCSSVAAIAVPNSQALNLEVPQRTTSSALRRSRSASAACSPASARR